MARLQGRNPLQGDRAGGGPSLPEFTRVANLGTDWPLRVVPLQWVSLWQAGPGPSVSGRAQCLQPA